MPAIGAQRLEALLLQAFDIYLFHQTDGFDPDRIPNPRHPGGDKSGAIRIWTSTSCGGL